MIFAPQQTTVISSKVERYIHSVARRERCAGAFDGEKKNEGWVVETKMFSLLSERLMALGALEGIGCDMVMQRC